MIQSLRISPEQALGNADWLMMYYICMYVGKGAIVISGIEMKAEAERMEEEERKETEITKAGAVVVVMMMMKEIIGTGMLCLCVSERRPIKVNSHL